MGEEEFLVPAAFFALAACLYAWAWSRSFRARRLYRKALRLEAKTAVPNLLDALWLAREAPTLETEILDRIEVLSQELGIQVDLGDYRALVRQVETLSGRGTAASIEKMGQALELKGKLLERLTQVFSGSPSSDPLS